MKCGDDYSLFCCQRSCPHGATLSVYRSIPFADGAKCPEDLTVLGDDSLYFNQFARPERRLGAREHS